VDAVFVEIFGVCLEGPWKRNEETDPKYRYHYTKWANTNCLDIQTGHLPNNLYYRYSHLATTDNVPWALPSYPLSAAFGEARYEI
jgi:hypothetical protein